MKTTDADYEDHFSKLESGYKATFGEDLPTYIVTQTCFDLLAQKKVEYVRAYLRTWSGMELAKLANMSLRKEVSIPPGLVAMIESSPQADQLSARDTLKAHEAHQNAELAKSLKATQNAKEVSKENSPKREKKIQSIEQARAKRADKNPIETGK